MCRLWLRGRRMRAGLCGAAGDSRTGIREDSAAEVGVRDSAYACLGLAPPGYGMLNISLTTRLNLEFRFSPGGQE